MMSDANKGKTLVVLFDQTKDQIDESAVYLSFLKPQQERHCDQDFLNRCIFASDYIEEIRNKATDLYVELVANISLAKTQKTFSTFRQDLKLTDSVSAWWFHYVSAKDSESDPTLIFIMHILLIEFVYSKFNCEKITLMAADQKISDVLASRYEVCSLASKKSNELAVCFIACIKRIKFFINFSWQLCLLKLFWRKENSKFDVCFSSFWNWSFQSDEKDGQLFDRYYKALPGKLRKKGVQSGWLAWLDYHYQAGGVARKNFFQVMVLLKNRSDVAIVQSFISFAEFWSSVFNLNPFFLFLKYHKESAFKNALTVEGLNFYPLFYVQLKSGFLDATLPRQQLVYLGHCNAIKQLVPKAVVTFMNLFPFARAACAGIKEADSTVEVFDVQHASYSFDKTICSVSKELELNHPYSLVYPDYVFTMGELGREYFLKNGFSKEQVLALGSCRYDNCYSEINYDIARLNKGKNILIVTALSKDLGVQMIDTVYHAFKNIFDVNIRLRPHPFSASRLKSQVKSYLNRIEFSELRSLEDDLRQADIVIFSYSTVAEESFIQGIPVWQWRNIGPNFSVFSDLDMAPKFSSIKELTNLYEDFQSDPEKFLPSNSDRQYVNRKCFYSEGGLPSDNIADFVYEQVSSKQNINFKVRV